MARTKSYEKASEKLEEYAKQYAGEADAFAAMNDAVLYRRGSGQDDKAIENTKFFIRTFGAKQPQAAANAMFSLTSIYEKQGDGDAVVKHLRAYLRQFGGKGGRDRIVIAHAKIGQTLWAQSCRARADPPRRVPDRRRAAWHAEGDRRVAARAPIARLESQ